jgi:ATP-dependent Lhr-like helicase
MAEATPLRYRPVTIVNAAARKQLKLRIEVPVEDMARLGEMEEIPSGPASQTPRRVSIWNAIHPRLLEIIRERNSTILFVNARQTAERLAGALNDLAGEPIARAHHGSLAAAQRSVIEEQLKAGQIKALCATSTLELGIDMGAVDLVVQIESPPSVASGMQRIGRAGHHVDAVSEGILFPKYRADLVACAAVTRAMHEGHIESTRFPRNPLDVLCQQLVAIVASARPPKDARPAKARKASRRGKNLAANLQFDGFDSRELSSAEAPKPEVSVDLLFNLVRGAAPLARCRVRPSMAFSTCSAAGIPPTSLASCARGSHGIAYATWSRLATAQRGWRF